MAAQELVPASSARQLPSTFNPARQIAGTARFAASCSIVAAAALGGCAADEPALELAACDAPEVYRIDRVELPRTNPEALALGLDVDLGHPDNVASIDNQLGLVIAMLHTQLGPLDMAAVTSDRLAGEVEWTLATRACGDRVAVSLGRADRLGGLQLVGAAGPGTLEARGAGGELPLSLMFDPAAAIADPGWLPAALAAIELDRSADGARLTARLGVALDDTAAFEAVVPPLARYLDAHLEPGSYFATYFDRDQDGRITEQELREGSILRAMFAPDLRAGDAPAISLGIGLGAVRVP
jgi:hypothetical protein